MSVIIQVALPVPLFRFFDYRIESIGQDDLTTLLGKRVSVPFGPRQVVGMIVDVQQDVDYDQSKIKSIIELKDSEAIFDSTFLSLAKWLSDFYLHPLGEVIATMLPVLLRKSAKVEWPHIEYLSIDQSNPQDLDVKLGRSKLQLALFKQLEKGEQALKEVRKKYNAATVKALIDKGLIQKQSKPIQAQDWQAQISVAEKPRPNLEQSIAISTINEAVGFNTFLLEGVTGSGKTEVYLQIIEPLLLAGKQVLILVPEIGLTPQTVSRFESRFGISVGVLHSNLNNKERALVWKQAKEGEIGIVIGTRSSIFTILKNPGMIIVDEEHDESFKQQDGLRYHARDVAAYRSKQLNIPLVLGSATPSLESLHNTIVKKFRHLPLTQRAGNATMPTQLLMDMRNQNLQFGIADSMLEKIKVQLEQGNQVMVFVNRRGYAPSIMCHSCGHVESCEPCATPFTVHKSTRNLQCHRCAATRYIPNKCSRCGHKELVTEGIGTEQIQLGLEQLFPDYKSIRIDSDSVRGKGKLSRLLTQINNNEYQLLIGTQILSKGHHFPNVTMVLILNVDGALFSADFRAPEKLAQLITQLAGRAGRSDKQGEMWLQTHNPQHPLLQDLINNGYGDFARFALLERKHALLPPYEYQIALRVESTYLLQAEKFLKMSQPIFEQFQKLRAIGPFPAFIEKKQGRFRMLLIVQSASRSYLNKAMAQVVNFLDQQAESKRVKWYVDVNPIDFN